MHYIVSNKPGNSNGQWAPFETQNQTQARLGNEVANGIGGFFAGGIAAIFAAPVVLEGVPAVLSAVTTQATNVAVNAAAAYYRYGPALAAAGKFFAEFMDESGGSIATGGGASLKLVSTVFEDAKGLIGAAFKFDNGKTLDFLANKVVNGKTLELTDAILYPRGAAGNEEAGKFGGDAVKSLLDKLKEYAKSQGFEQLRITYKRAENSSSANPGSTVDRTFNLNE
jgi:hypothetical protein